MGRLSWILWVGPKCNHMGPYKRDPSQGWRVRDVMMGRGVEPRAKKGCREPLEAGKRQGGGFSPSHPPPGETSPADTLMFSPVKLTLDL